jgi:hypothetical protein
MSLAFDHAILGAADLEATAAALLETHGLASVAGGRHTGHGTGNRIVPLGSDYLELMAILDLREAESSPMGRWVRDQVAAGRDLMALCLRSDDLESVARRHGLAVTALSRVRPDGRELRCRLAGLEAAMGPERLPFFIQWDVPTELHPGRDRAPHRARPLGIAWAEVGGDPDRLTDWVGDPRLDLRPAGGDPGVRAVGIRTADGELRLPSPAPR